VIDNVGTWKVYACQCISVPIDEKEPKKNLRRRKKWCNPEENVTDF